MVAAAKISPVLVPDLTGVFLVQCMWRACRDDGISTFFHSKSHPFAKSHSNSRSAWKDSAMSHLLIIHTAFWLVQSAAAKS
jgi:hypothetical protein